MVMRYEWGLGIGHTYSWMNQVEPRQAPDSPDAGLNDPQDEDSPDDPIDDIVSGFRLDGAEDDAGFGLDDQENEDLGDEESDGDLHETTDGDESGDADESGSEDN